jgi:hypothetical protein
LLRADGYGFVQGGVDLLNFHDGMRCAADTVHAGDVRASTAALLSARFPYVSPSGELFRCEQVPGGGEQVVRAGTPGGPDVVVPLLVLVDNDYETSVVPGPVQRQRELSAPIELLGAQGVLSDQGVLEQRALLAFSGGSPGLADAGSVRFFRVGPTRRPGVAAPLGWTLPDITRRDLDAQLGAANGGSCPAESGLVPPLPLPCFPAALVGGP